MQKISSELVDNRIIIKKPKDVGRLFNKSSFGKIISGNKLVIDLIEGVFLLAEEKIRLFRDGKEIELQNLLKFSAKQIPHFEIKYLVFRDLKKKGYSVKINKENKEYDFHIIKKENAFKKLRILCYISVFSERDIMDINIVKSMIKTTIKNNVDLWFTIVDEEGDITYYNVSLSDIKGEVSEHKFSKTTGLKLENRLVIFDKKIAKNLFEMEFYGKPFGTGLQLSMVEALYLLEKKVIDIKDVTKEEKFSPKTFKTLIKKTQPDINLRFFVFSDLKKRGLIVKTGFKFGVHFRAYTRKPDEIHAEYLLHVVDKEFKVTWAEISRAVRLAHSVNKEIIFARVKKSKIDYIKLGRLRP
jgi:tRNA-intron endonuclease